VKTDFEHLTSLQHVKNIAYICWFTHSCNGNHNFAIVVFLVIKVVALTEQDANSLRCRRNESALIPYF
jgi:hypothetical protein